MDDKNQVKQNQQPINQQIGDQQVQDQKPQPVSVGVDKEKEMPKPAEEPITDVKEHEIPKELKEHVVKTKEEIEIPPDLKKMGVSTPPASAKVSDVVTGAVKLPLTDDEIEQGVHMKVMNSFRWLAEWCLKQLKKAHIQLTKQGEHYKREKGEK